MASWSAVILVYGDDSSDEKGERVRAVGGVVCETFGWRALEREWLIRTGGVPFHAKDCDSDRNDYKNTPHAENKALYKDLAIMTANSRVYGIGVAIDLMALKRVFPEAEELAYYRAFLRVVEVMKDAAKETGEIADFTFDMNLETHYNAGLLYGVARESEPTWKPYLAEKITFTFAHKEPRIQVADLVAHEAMKALDNQVGPIKRPVRKSWDALHASGRFIVEGYTTEWFNDLKKNYGELEKTVGFTWKDYFGWLANGNRQHNISNLIHFTNWIAKRDRNAE